MADIEITHTREEGTLLDGSSKGDGVYEIVSQHGFRFSRNVGIYIRGSRDKEAQHWRINGAKAALEAAGHTVTVTINEEDERSAAEIEEAREARAEERAERFADRAGRAAAASDARWNAADSISRRFEFGQPILVGHHSERRARRDQERMHDNMRASIEENKRAGYWAGRAEAAASYKEHRTDPYRTLRRLEKLRADLRQQERHHAEAIKKGWDSVDRHARLIRDLSKEIEHWEEVVEKAKAEGVKIWGPTDFVAGDYVMYLGSWYQVKRVNPKTLSIAWNLRIAPKAVMTLEDATARGRVWTHPADYTKVRARCPEAAMNAFLAEGKVPGTKLAMEAAQEQPASDLRAAREAKPKPQPKPKRSSSDPNVPKRVHVTCPPGGSEATLTWWNGNSRPHKDFKPVTITAEEGGKFHRSVWSRPLREKIEQVLDGQGYVLDGDGWVLSRDRVGFVRAVKPKPKPESEAAPEVEQSEGPAAEVERPAPDVRVEEGDAAGREAPAADAAEGDAQGQATGQEKPNEGVEKTAPELHISAQNPVPQGTPEVRLSAYPLNPNSKEAPTVTATTARTRKATKKAAEAAPAKAETKTVQKRVPVDRIDRDPNQPREEFDQAKLEELAGSMRKLGQLQPVSLRYVPGTKRYVLTMGERRWRAAQMAGITELDAVVAHGVQEGDRETLARQVAENVGRADMTPMEEAKSFQRLRDAEYSVDEVAEMCGKSAAYVGWRVDLLRLCDSAQEALGKGHLPVGLAWYVSRLSRDNQVRFLAKYANGKLGSDADAQSFAQAVRHEEERREEQGSFFVLVEEAGKPRDGEQDVLPGAHDIPEEERERVTAERAKLTKKIDRLSGAGEILAELATMDPEELALLLAGTPGGVPGHQLRIKHLRDLTAKAAKNLREAQAIAAVRANGIEINPEAAA